MAFFLLNSRRILPPHLLEASHTHLILGLPFPCAMPPKTSKSRGKETKADVPESELVKRRKKFVVFAPSLDAKALRHRYQCMWAKETRAPPATRVIPGAC